MRPIRDEARPLPERDRETPARAGCAAIVLAGQHVDYRLVRARRRSIGMEVDLDGLTVRAPRWVTLARHRAGARASARDWIVQVARRMARRAGAT